MLVMKFGGSSLATREHLLAARDQVLESSGKDKTVVVVSAIGQTTDVLIGADADPVAAAAALLGIHEHALGAIADAPRESVESALRSLPDRIGTWPEPEVHSLGERISSAIFHALLVESGCPAQDFGLHAVALRAGAVPAVDQVATARRFLDLGFDPRRPEVTVVGGFGGISPTGCLRLLGRGGSDTSATSIGAALGARVVELWKDVDGIHARDPREHSDSRLITHMRWSEADALARTGARILHGPSIEPAWRARIPIHVRHTGHPEEPGTWIADVHSRADDRRSVA